MATYGASSGRWGSKLDAGDSICLAIVRGDPVPMEDLRFLYRMLGKDEPWAYTVVTSVILADALLARGRALEAARALDKGVDGYRKLLQLARKHRPGFVPEELARFEARCRDVLDSFEPPIAHGRSPVRKVRETVRSMRKPPRRHSTRETIDALDAVITAGEAAGKQDLEVRVVEQLARMLGGRVLLHHVRGEYVAREAQDVHTLSSWTMLKLATQTRVRAVRIRKRPEFWRPEQRRPRGVLAFPIGEGHAAIARGRPFNERDVRAARTILRFLAQRRGHPAAPPEASATKPAAHEAHTRPQGLIGSSAAWRRVLDDVWRFGPTDCSVVIEGETGTGKELVARALHMNSNRAQGPFVAINCAALQGDTMLAELFGHVRGAFSGATESRDGLMRSAHRGTLFLDEVGDMPHAMQVALLRALQERRVRPVGSARTKAVDVRIVAATHADLDQHVREGRFREDLRHRLGIVSIALPALRDRRDDLPELSRHLLDRHGQSGTRITADAQRTLAAHAWPGNVRELENVLRAAVVLRDGDAIDERTIRAALDEPRPSEGAQGARLTIGPRSTRMLDLLGGTWWSAPELAVALGVSTRTVNRDLASLQAQQLVVRDGSARASRYRATSSLASRGAEGPAARRSAAAGDGE